MKIKWHIKAFEELRRTPGVRADLAERVQRIEAQLPPGYESGVDDGRTRARGHVVTATPDAMRSEAVDHALLRALDAGRG